MEFYPLYQCIKDTKSNQSQSREILYRVFLEADKCLDISELLKKLKECYAKKISLNTLYRHLDFFIKCKLIIVIQNNNKKSFYCLNEDKIMLFSLCLKCSKLEKLNNNVLCKQIAQRDKSEFIVLYKICNNCK